MAYRGNQPRDNRGGGGQNRGDYQGYRGGGGDNIQRGGYENNYGGGNYRGGNQGDCGNRGGGGGGFVRGRGGERGGRGGGRGGFRAPAKPHVLVGEGAIFPLQITPGSKAYRYDVSMEHKFNIPGLTEASLTKMKRDPRMRELCFQILTTVMEATNNFGVENLQVAYDNQNSLFASQPFTPVSYTVTIDQVPTELQKILKGTNEVTVKIKPNEKMGFVDLSDVSQYQSGEIVFDEDQSVRQVLEIILTQGALNSGEYELIGSGKLYRFKEEPVGRGLCTRKGTSKGIRMIEIDEGENPKKIVPALVVDFKCSPFYSAGKLLDKVDDFVREDPQNPRTWDDASKFFKGCKVCPIYEQHRVLVIKDFDRQRLNEISFKLESGENITLPEFYRTKKHQRIQYQDTYAVNMAGDKGQFPMELLTILPNQKINLGDKVPTFLSNKVHKSNAVVPQERYTNIMDEVENMEFNNEITKAFGIRVSLEPIEKADVLQFQRPPKPTILVGNNYKIQPNDDGKFDLRDNIYFQPCTIERWGVLYGHECQEKTIKDFIQSIKTTAQSRGIKFQFDANLLPFDTRKATVEQWIEKFKFFQEKKVSLIIMIDSKSNFVTHGMLKMMESFTKVLTQHITLEVVKKVVEERQFQTLTNILLKINVKNGGINYKPMFNKTNKLDLNTGDVLVVGYDVAHPTGVSPDEKQKNRKDGHKSETNDPSVVGITANVAADPTAFVGDFFYQPTCQERKSRNGKLPKIIVILRDGVSEGQFKMTFDDELPAIRQGVADVDSSYKPEFVFIICTKRHHKRFFEGERGEFENPQAGSFVEDKFTRPDCIEFFMQCHNAIKGTVKFVQVNVVLNDPKVTKKELFDFLHSLSYGHQIVCSPVSLPTPIYQADELAARGFEVYLSVKKHIPKYIKWDKGEINYLELSTLLNYSNSSLENRRFNA